MTIQWSLLLLVAACTVPRRHALARLLDAGPLVRIGAVSYGIYLYHLLVRHVVDTVMRFGGLFSQLTLFVATALGSWAVAEISYRAFEKRFLALKARWA